MIKDLRKSRTKTFIQVNKTESLYPLYIRGRLIGIYNAYLRAEQAQAIYGRTIVMGKTHEQAIIAINTIMGGHSDVPRSIDTARWPLAI